MHQSVDDGSGDVSIEEFSAVCNEIGVVVSPKEAQGLFNRYGYDNVMPYERFAHYLLTQPARQVSMLLMSFYPSSHHDPDSFSPHNPLNQSTAR